MHNHQHNLKTHNMSKLLVIGLSIILLTGISLVPTLQIKVQGQVRQSPAPPTPGGSPSSGTPPPPAASEDPSHQEVVHHQELHHHQQHQKYQSHQEVVHHQELHHQTLDTADGGEAANQTSGEGGVQSTKVLWY